MAEVVEWVSDRLHELLGLSDRYTAEFLVGLARKASSSESYLQQLENTGAIAINDDVRSFASQLWARVPHRAAVEKPARAREREVILQRQRNKAYQLLSDDEEDVKTTVSTARSEKGTCSEASIRATMYCIPAAIYYTSVCIIRCQCTIKTSSLEKEEYFTVGE